MNKQHRLLFFFVIFSITSKGQSLDTLIRVGKHRLHFEILKGGKNVILFEAGNGDDASVWKPILQDIYKATAATLIAYDRAGLGKSEIDTTTISFQQEVKDLIKALRQMGYRKKYFLVAHSFGGFYASEFANRNKRKISGAIFIDVGLPCELNKEFANKVKNSISAENWAMVKEYKIGLYYVLLHFPEIVQYMSNRYISNSIPLTLIAAENREPTKEIGETEQDMLNWAKCLQDFGNLPNHNYVLAPNTDHKVWEKNPQLVVNEIIKRYQKANNRRYNGNQVKL